MNSRVSSLRVLYAEDETEMRESVATILRRRVKTVVPTANGQEAFDRFMEGSTDLLITDLQMPVMNGLILAKKIHEISPDFPIIVMSAFNDENHVVPEATVTIFKPVVKQDLLNAIETCLDKMNL